MKKLGMAVFSGLAAFALIGVMAFLVSIGDRLVRSLLGH